MVLWNFDLLCKNYDTMGKNYGTIQQNMVLYRKLCNFDLLWKKTIVLWKKIWYYGKI